MQTVPISGLNLPEGLAPLYTVAQVVMPENLHKLVTELLGADLTPRLFENPHVSHENREALKAALQQRLPLRQDTAKLLEFLIKMRVQLLALPSPTTLMEHLRDTSSLFGFTACIFVQKANNTSYACTLFVKEAVRALAFAIRDNHLYYLAPVSEAEHSALILSRKVYERLRPTPWQSLLHCGHLSSSNTQCQECGEQPYAAEQAVIAAHQACEHLKRSTVIRLQRCPTHNAGIQLNALCGCTFCGQCVSMLRQCPNGHELNDMGKAQLIWFISSLHTSQPINCSVCGQSQPDFVMKTSVGHDRCSICEKCALLALCSGQVLPCCNRQAQFN